MKTGSSVVMFVRGNAFIDHLGALVAQIIFTSESLALPGVSSDGGSDAPVFSYDAGLDYITLHSLTPAIPCAALGADGSLKATEDILEDGEKIPSEEHLNKKNLEAT